MAATVRNTGTHFRYDDDDAKWKAKLHLQVKSNNELTFDVHIGDFATLEALIAWLQGIFADYASRPDTTVLGT